MNRKDKFVLLNLIVLSLMVASQSLCAQQTGTLKGQVLDRSGAGVDWAIVSVGMDSQKFQTKPDRDGKFELSLPEGTYNVIVKCNGFKPSRERQIKVIAPQTTEISITLNIQGENEDNDFVIHSGALKGRVLDRKENGVPSARITVGLGSQILETKSDKDGKFELTLPEGTHSVLAQSEGFKFTKMTGVEILAEQTTEISIYLEVRSPPQPYVPIVTERETKKDSKKP